MNEVGSVLRGLLHLRPTQTPFAENKTITIKINGAKILHKISHTQIKSKHKQTIDIYLQFSKNAYEEYLSKWNHGGYLRISNISKMIVLFRSNFNEMWTFTSQTP